MKSLQAILQDASLYAIVPVLLFFGSLLLLMLLMMLLLLLVHGLLLLLVHGLLLEFSFLVALLPVLSSSSVWKFLRSCINNSD